MKNHCTQPKLSPFGCGPGGRWSDLTTSLLITDNDTATYRVSRPQPILSDVGFDTDGSMILGLMERTGHQTSRNQASTYWQRPVQWLCWWRYPTRPGLPLWYLSDDDSDRRYLGKANGLGSIGALCEAAPIVIGSRLWVDADKNGV